MKLQEILLPVLFAFITVWGISYFFGGKKVEDTTQLRSGQQFTVMPTIQMCQPVNMEIDFFDAHGKQEPVLTDLQGYRSDYMFSSAGAIVDSLKFKRDLGGVEGTITTIFPSSLHQEEKGAFIVALQEATPLDFKLIDQKQTEEAARITYESTNNNARIIKEFIVSKKNYSINMVVTIEPIHKDSIIQPRIFIPGPYMPELEKQEHFAGIVYTEREALEKIASETTGGFAWRSPQIFGVEDRYFVNALVHDQHHFTQRAYFKREEGGRLIAILEGPSITEKKSWTLTFYCGPKEGHELAVVDKRLETIMDYGWLAPISKFLLYLLNLIYYYVGNYGWAIIILTLFMRLIMYPFARSGERNLRKQNELAEKMKYLSQKYKDDAIALREAQAELARKHGLSPVAGCLPLLLQIPIFVGLNYALRNSIELYRAPFVLWIKDLSVKDPYYVIPGLVGLTFFWSMSATSKDPRHKVAMLVLSLFLIAVLANISAGLGLFIGVSSLFGVIQTKLGKGMSWQAPRA
jgi:YidC/Oxa1 family membrane protein insertase